MTDREKVVKGLESLQGICNAKADMAVGEGRTVWAGYASVAYLALALLREQEPRVMTLEEAQNAEIVWIEQVGTIVAAMRVETLSKSGTIIFAYEHDCGVLAYVNIKPEYYGKVSRCWTARPTEEQREAVKWE